MSGGRQRQEREVLGIIAVIFQAGRDKMNDNTGEDRDWSLLPQHLLQTLATGT